MTASLRAGDFCQPPHPQCLRGVTANILKCRTLDLFFFFAPNDRRRTDLTNFLNCQPSYMLESLGFVSVRFLQKQHFLSNIRKIGSQGFSSNLFFYKCQLYVKIDVTFKGGEHLLFLIFSHLLSGKGGCTEADVAVPRVFEWRIEHLCLYVFSSVCQKGWLAIAKLKPLSLFISLFLHYQVLS